MGTEIAREAYNQSAERLADVLDTKKVFEQKAQAFFGGYTAIALALFGAAGATVTIGESWIATGLFLAGCSFVVGAALCAWALRDKPYAAAGTSPKQWLYRGAIDAPANSLPKLLSYLTWHRQDEIDKSAKNNSDKAKLVRGAIVAGMVGPGMLAMALIFSLAGAVYPFGTNPAEAATEVAAEVATTASTCSCSCASSR